MSGALVGAVSCGRCGLPDAQDATCPRCDAAWVEAAPGGAAAAEPGPLLGVVRAATAARVAAALLDVALPAALLVAVGLATSSTALRILGIAGVLLVVVGQLVLLLTRGRSVGRLLLGQRTVDDLTGQPVRWRRLWHQLAGGGGERRRLTADLRRGQDPAAPVPSVPTAPSVRGRTTTPAAQPWTPTAEPVAATEPATPATPAAPSVGIVLANGERYEIFGSLLLGRSPSDPGGQSDRALLAWPDLSRRLAKTHALLEWSGSVLWVTDLHTVTGTTLVDADGQRRPLAPGVRVPASVGSSLECGGRLVQVVPGG